MLCDSITQIEDIDSAPPKHYVYSVLPRLCNVSDGVRWRVIGDERFGEGTLPQYQPQLNDCSNWKALDGVEEWQWWRNIDRLLTILGIYLGATNVEPVVNTDTYILFVIV